VIFLLGIILGLLAGILMSVQGVFNTKVMEASNMWATNTWVHLNAFLVSLLIWFGKKDGSLGSVFDVENKVYLLGGIIGALITFTVIKSIGGLGPIYATMLILIAQLLTSGIIEAFGFFGTEKIPFEWRKVIGVGLMLLGIILFRK
jgi:transporter family-2 protein